MGNYVGNMKQETFDLINSALARSRGKYPKNLMMLSSLIEEVSELCFAFQMKSDPVQHDATEYRHQRIKEEASDIIAICIRIMEEGDASFDPIPIADTTGTMDTTGMSPGFVCDCCEHNPRRCSGPVTSEEVYSQFHAGI